LERNLLASQSVWFLHQGEDDGAERVQIEKRETIDKFAGNQNTKSLKKYPLHNLIYRTKKKRNRKPYRQRQN
jgi:hypothetical protein